MVGGYSTIPFANLKGEKGDPGERGPAGPPNPETVPAIEAFAAMIEADFEGPVATALLGLLLPLLDGFSPNLSMQLVEIDDDEDINKPRPVTASGAPWPGRVFWLSKKGRPGNALPRDVYFPWEVDIGSFLPTMLAAVYGWYSPKNTGVEANKVMPSFPDSGPAGRALGLWSASGGSTNSPSYVPNALNGTPGVVLTTRSGFTVASVVAAPGCVLFFANFQFTGQAPGTLNQFLNSMGDAGKYSISRTPGGKWAASIDGVTFYEFGAWDNDPHTWVLQAVKTKLQVWLDGNLVLDQDVAFTELPSVSIYRIGFVGTGSSNNNWKYSGGGVLGDNFATTPPAALTAKVISILSQWGKLQRNA